MARESSINRPKVVSGFTLVEILVVVVILSVMVTIVVPMFSESNKDTKEIAAITLVKGIVEQIDVYHVTHGSWPPNIQREWFRSYKLPVNPWAPDHDKSINSDLDGLSIVKWHPIYKTIAIFPFWYNPSNGAFRIRVPEQSTADETLALYNLVNQSSVTTINATERFY